MVYEIFNLTSKRIKFEAIGIDVEIGVKNKDEGKYYISQKALTVKAKSSYKTFYGFRENPPIVSDVVKGIYESFVLPPSKKIILTIDFPIELYFSIQNYKFIIKFYKTGKDYYLNKIANGPFVFKAINGISDSKKEKFIFK